MPCSCGAVGRGILRVAKWGALLCGEIILGRPIPFTPSSDLLGPIKKK